ncbi:myo-inosose-2 dehydratase [Endozoicomonas sp. SM1973]|uniref:Myo-inosose-2 dehydratase n=1 Tax=Spartinivicinus marinus TaxID=2994442 RepID=A0A853IF65_9GAMM|nr:myo-inosose-2 dehydratase [Spartinivicinus marinus]MCX4025942.1 myo-inosose-2 dehydratase [Spartinivicinus marinus]NYZ68127.1 myo-inosose-2 dehydratase [Spartinivicinus marinus]
MAVKIGINPLTWTNDDMPALGAETPLEVCLTEGKQAGYSGFELGNKFPREAEVLGPILDKHGLQLVSGWYSGQLMTRTVDEEIAAIQSHLQLLRSLGSSVMVFAEVTGCIHGKRQTPLTCRPVFAEADWQSYADRLTQLADYTLSEGVKIAYHHHMGTVIETEAEIDQLMVLTGKSVGLLLDTGHLTYAGGDPLATAKRHIQRICHVHCKDIRPVILQWAKNTDSSFLNAVLQGVFTVPGDGCIDYPSIFQLLREHDYNGWLVVEAEQDPAIADPLTYAKMGYHYLAEQVSKAGLKLVS